jgi:hypothetical protein
MCLVRLDVPGEAGHSVPFDVRESFPILLGGDPVTLKEFYAEVASKADNDKQKINAADVARVLSVAFSLLVTKDPATMAALVAKGLENAAKKNAK